MMRINLHGLSQKKIAKEIGVSSATISNVIRRSCHKHQKSFEECALNYIAMSIKFDGVYRDVEMDNLRSENVCLKKKLKSLKKPSFWQRIFGGNK